MAKRKGKQRKRRKLHTVKYFDYSLLFFLFLLLGVGYVMLYSTSAYMATLAKGDGAYYLKRQIYASVLGFFALFLFTFKDYRLLKKFASLLYIGSFALCVYVQFFGTSINNSSRWIRLGPFSFQPSELAKVAVIVCMAKIISEHQDLFRDNIKMLKVMAFLMIPIGGIVAANNLSTALIIAGIAFTMAFVANPNYKVFVAIICGGGLLAFIMMLLPGMTYRFERISIWLHPEESEKGYQTLQGLYAIGSGGLFGKGLGESTQKLGFVPEAQNDMIFSIICEELGLFGAICIITLYLLLLWRCLIIALNAKDKFGSFLVTGVMVHIALQVIMNVAVVTNSMPNTGVTLPFISYGGSSIAILIGEIGIVLGVSRSMKYDEE
ncbi:MAG: putative lipid II flippase FtsW [Lachnospiraceae bacterium]|nr:putative lipid II flippase FtsW [Lachnospiraceae bacterium]